MARTNPNIFLKDEILIRSREIGGAMRSIHLFLALLFLVQAASAHAPMMAETGGNISTAMPVDDPSKSRSVYSTIPAGSTHYYSFNFNAGDRIRLELISSPKDSTFAPGFALIGPGLEERGTVPPGVTIPDGMSAIAVNGTSSDGAIYEPFGPSSYYRLGSIDVKAPENGTYYAAIYSQTAGNYALAVGYREAFTLDEWIMLRTRLTSYYRWEGQGIPEIIGPMMVVLLGGFYILKRRWRLTAPGRGMASMAGLLFFGTSATVLYQMAFSLSRSSEGAAEAWITVILAALPAALGAAVIYLAIRRDGEFSRQEKLILRLVGAAALLTSAGLLIGPLMAIVSTMMSPQERAGAKRDGRKGRRG